MPTIVRVAHFDVNLSRVLGEGGFGKVFRAKDISEDPPMECAAKQVTSMPEAELKKEVELMRQVGDHPSIISFRHFEQVAADHETPEVRNSSWIFMEMATGGELFDRLIDSGNLTERAVAPYFKGIVEGLLHCHARGVVHRDIKLENVMLCAEDPHVIKLVDFGLAVRMPSKADGGGGFEEGALLYDKVGSKSYRAPEVLASRGYRAPPVDVWALGITVFSLVSGFFPLDEAKESDWRFARMASSRPGGSGRARASTPCTGDSAPLAWSSRICSTPCSPSTPPGASRCSRWPSTAGSPRGRRPRLRRPSPRTATRSCTDRLGVTTTTTRRRRLKCPSRPSPSLASARAWVTRSRELGLAGARARYTNLSPGAVAGRVCNY